MTKNVFLGVDVSKDTLDFALCRESNPEDYVFLRVSNDRSGFKALLRWLKSNNVDLKKLKIIMEHTGVYMIDFMMFLESSGLEQVIVSGLQIKKSLGIQRGKNDKVDARRIAYYGFLMRHRLVASKLPTKDIVRLREIFNVRSTMVKNATALKNQIHTLKKSVRLTQNPAILSFVRDALKKAEADIKVLDKMMNELVSKSGQLKTNYKLLLSVKGIGPVIACMFIIYTNNFESFENGRQFMCYCGAAPFPHESGTYKGKNRVSKLGNRKLKTLLVSSARSASIHDKILKAYYQRKRSEGKGDRQVINALVGKIILRAFAVVKRQSPFVVIYSENFKNKQVA